MSCEGIAEGSGQEGDVCEGFARGRNAEVANANICDDSGEEEDEI